MLKVKMAEPTNSTKLLLHAKRFHVQVPEHFRICAKKVEHSKDGGRGNPLCGGVPVTAFSPYPRYKKPRGADGRERTFVRGVLLLPQGPTPHISQQFSPLDMCFSLAGHYLTMVAG